MSRPRRYYDEGTDIWPSLPLNEWQDSYSTLHMWTQIAGKIKLALAPMVNHWWQVALYVTTRGLTTAPIPYGQRTFQMDFDFTDHELRITTDDGEVRSVALTPRSVADFYQEVMSTLSSLGMGVRIWTTPVEVADPIPFDQDRVHGSYDPEYAHCLWRILWQVDRVFNIFRSSFILPYDDVRRADSPDDLLLQFLQSTYEAAANTAKWDREALERTWPVPRTSPSRHRAV